MTTKHALILSAALIVAIVGGLALHAYIGSRIDMAKLDAIRQEVKIANDKAEATAKQAEQDRLDAQKRDADRTLQLAQTLAAITAQKQQPVNLDQVAAMIGARIPQAAVSKEELSQLPDAPSAVKGIRDYMLDCDSCKVERDSLKQSGLDKDKQLADLGTEKQSLLEEQANTKRELNAAIKAAKGTFWTRLKSCGVEVGVGGVAGGVAGASSATGSSTKGAELGAAIGAAACFLSK